jgi:hypothetical protein
LGVWWDAWFALLGYVILDLMLIGNTKQKTKTMSFTTTIDIVLTLNPFPRVFAWKPGAIFLDFLSIAQAHRPLPAFLRITDGGHYENTALFQQLSLPAGKV